jgi:hypothetical protein
MLLPCLSFLRSHKRTYERDIDQFVDEEGEGLMAVGVKRHFEFRLPE